MREFDYDELTKKEIVQYLRQNIRPTFTEEEFEWEFNEFGKGVVFKLIKSNDKIIASQAMLPIKLIVNSVSVMTAKSEISFLDREFRGNNYFEELYESAIKETRQKGSQLIWGFTPAVKVWKNKLNFDLVKANISEARIIFSKYPSDFFLKTQTNNRLYQLGKRILYFLLRIAERKAVYVSNLGELRVSYEFPNSSLIDDFQKKLSINHGFNVFMNMSNEYIKWRILTNPLLKYKSNFFYSEDILVGYVIYSIKNDRLAIADISFLDNETGSKILSYLLHNYSSKVRSILYFGGDDSQIGKNIFTLFTKYGAKVSKSDWANTVIKDISPDKKYISQLDTSKCYINGLWTEGYSI